MLDVKTIINVALFMVGITQLLKGFFSVKNTKIKIIITIFTGAVASVLLHFAPAWVFNGLLGISVGVVFYDYFLKMLEKLIGIKSANLKAAEEAECGEAN